jgi:hypothetical protein
MKRWAGVSVLAAGLALASPGTAQVPQAGARSFQLSPYGDTQVGGWKMVSDRTNLGLAVGLEVGRTGGDVEGSRTSVAVAPSLKRYGDPVGPVAPYLFGSLPLGLERRSADRADVNERVLRLGGALGVGLDWFPVRGVSLGSHVGVNARREWERTSSGEGASSEVTYTVAGTFSSGLNLHIYF